MDIKFEYIVLPYIKYDTNVTKTLSPLNEYMEFYPDTLDKNILKEKAQNMLNRYTNKYPVVEVRIYKMTKKTFELFEKITI